MPWQPYGASVLDFIGVKPNPMAFSDFADNVQQTQLSSTAKRYIKCEFEREYAHFLPTRCLKKL